MRWICILSASNPAAPRWSTGGLGLHVSLGYSMKDEKRGDTCLNSLRRLGWRWRCAWNKHHSRLEWPHDEIAKLLGGHKWILQCHIARLGQLTQARGKAPFDVSWPTVIVGERDFRKTGRLPDDQSA